MPPIENPLVTKSTDKKLCLGVYGFPMEPNKCQDCKDAKECQESSIIKDFETHKYRKSYTELTFQDGTHYKAQMKIEGKTAYAYITIETERPASALVIGTIESEFLDRANNNSRITLDRNTITLKVPKSHAPSLIKLLARILSTCSRIVDDRQKETARKMNQ